MPSILCKQDPNPHLIHFNHFWIVLLRWELSNCRHLNVLFLSESCTPKMLSSMGMGEILVHLRLSSREEKVFKRSCEISCKIYCRKVLVGTNFPERREEGFLLPLFWVRARRFKTLISKKERLLSRMEEQDCHVPYWHPWDCAACPNIFPILWHVMVAVCRWSSNTVTSFECNLSKVKSVQRNASFQIITLHMQRAMWTYVGEKASFLSLHSYSTGEMQSALI